MTASPRTILITGGAGFIGSALARALLARGDRIVIVDNLSTGFERNVPSAAEFVRGDVSDREVVRSLFARHRFDVVLHLAAQVSNIVSHQDPWLDMRTNVGGTINVLEEVRLRRVPRLLYASSMALYGTPDTVPVTEESRLRPLSPYGVSKLAAEHLVHNTARRNDLGFELSVTSLRMFNVYGPGQSLQNPYQGVVGVFISNVLRGTPITLYGDGNQTRDFVYIDDVVNCWLAALDNPAAAGQQFNVGSGREHSINELIDAVLSSFGLARSTYQVLRQPELPGDQRSIRADTSKANRLLGWAPGVPLYEGLTRTIEWGRTNWSIVGS